MCGRFALFSDEDYDEIDQIIDEVQQNQYRDRIKYGDIFPTDYVPVLALSHDSEIKEKANIFRWGFPNIKRPGSVVINARAETLEERPMFQRILYDKRCLIPSNGFYEWMGSDRKKDKYKISPEGAGFFFMAGLYNTFTGKNGEQETSFVIITTEANEQMSRIHDRMPILMTDPAQYNGWLSPELRRLSEIKAHLLPYSGNLSIENTSETVQLQFQF